MGRHRGGCFFFQRAPFLPSDAAEKPYRRPPPFCSLAEIPNLRIFAASMSKVNPLNSTRYLLRYQVRIGSEKNLASLSQRVWAIALLR